MSIASSYEEASSAYSHGTYRPEQQTKSISTQLKHRNNLIRLVLGYNLTLQTTSELYQTHVDQWKKIWDSGNILMEGPNLELVGFDSSLFFMMKQFELDLDFLT